MNTIIARTFALLFLTAAALPAQVPQLINYQGRVAVGAVSFYGTGHFKFALVDAAGTMTTGDAWQQRTGGTPPGGRFYHTAVWSGGVKVSNGTFSYTHGRVMVLYQRP